MRAAGIGFVASRHEGGAATMADAYARMSGEVGVVTLHQGCGLTNAATGIGEAAKSNTPMLVIAAEAASAAIHSNFAMDQMAFARSVGAVPERVHSPESALVDTFRAFRTAANLKKTVVLNFPLDVQSAESAAAKSIEDFQLSSLGGVVPNDAGVERLAEAITRSSRPVFIAGRGGRDAKSEILGLAKHVGALVATGAVAKGLFNEDEFNIGISGGFSSPTTAELIQNADLIVSFGCALNMWTMRHGRLIGEDTVVAQIDWDESKIGAHRDVDVPVVGDSAETAKALRSALEDEAGTRYRTQEVKSLIATSARWDQTATPDIGVKGETVDPRELTRRINELLPSEKVVSVDSGNFLGYPSQYLDVPDEFGFCFTQAFQAVGLGLYTAVGAAIAQPNRLPVLGTGDGGILMAAQELETAVRLQLPLLIIVYNDAAYGAEVHHFGSDSDLGAVVFPDTDIAAIARGYGAWGETIRALDDLEVIKTWLESNPRVPLLLDAKIANDGGSWWLAEAFQGH